MDCPVCSKEMFDNRENKKNPKSPDYRCKDKACKYEFDKKQNGWIPSEYGTAIWLPKGSPQEAKYTAKPAKTSILEAFDKEVGITHAKTEKSPISPILAPKTTTSDGMSKAEWSEKERREHKRALTMQAFQLFPPRNNEDGTTPMDRWMEVRDLRDIMLNDLYIKDTKDGSPVPF